jgi:hypothetical protein
MMTQPTPLSTATRNGPLASNGSTALSPRAAISEAEIVGERGLSMGHSPSSTGNSAVGTRAEAVADLLCEAGVPNPPSGR